jgi:predicted nucleic acid-binding protein
MKVFLDANILVTVLNKEYPLFSQAAQLISLADDTRFELFTSPLCMAIACYFSEKKSGRALTRKKMQLLVQKLAVTEHQKQDIQAVLNNVSITDFEDGLEYYSAKRAGCAVIVTEDLEDFYFSSLEVLTVAAFLQNYAGRQKNAK